MRDLLYPSPSEPRAKRRRGPRSGGSSFYIDRGRDFVGMNEYRDRRRAPEARQAVKLARELTKFAGEFPRFRLALNKLAHHVLLQVRAPKWKTRTILKYLDQRESTSVRELSKDTGLDYVSVNATLQELRAANLVVPCNRAGRPLVVDQGRTIYWLRK